MQKSTDKWTLMDLGTLQIKDTTNSTNILTPCVFTSVWCHFYTAAVFSSLTITNDRCEYGNLRSKKVSEYELFLKLVT